MDLINSSRGYISWLLSLVLETFLVMAEGGVLYPSVFNIDCSATYPQQPYKPPPVPQRPREVQAMQKPGEVQAMQRPGEVQAKQRPGVVQTLLLLLVSLALCGVVLEGCLIYRLYNPDFSDSGVLGKSVQDKSDIDTPFPTERPNFVALPTTPVAHLTAGPPRAHVDGVLRWNMEEKPLLNEMKYSEGHLLIQKEGLYYIYSKIYFKDTTSHFSHSVYTTTDRYNWKPIPLLQSQTHHSRIDKMSFSNSYLGGVFQFQKNDSIFVKASNTSYVIRSKSYENYFGVFMICCT